MFKFYGLNFCTPSKGAGTFHINIRSQQVGDEGGLSGRSKAAEGADRRLGARRTGDPLIWSDYTRRTIAYKINDLMFESPQ